MNALIVYESMFGSTHHLSESIAGALASTGAAVTVVTAAEAPATLSGYDLVVVGAPTHAHTLPQAASRSEAARWAADRGRALTLEAAAMGPGVREWLESVEAGEPAPRILAFSTRVDMPRIFAGDASAAIERRLHRRHIAVAAREDFLVDTDSHLVPGEDARAAEWAVQHAAVPSR